jgi:hypothetical protein
VEDPTTETVAIARVRVSVTDETTPVPAPMPPVSPAPVDAPCGFCGHTRAGHGTRYDTFGGYHAWRRIENPWYPRTPGGNR